LICDYVGMDPTVLPCGFWHSCCKR
jgi:hypothetical protein